MTKQQLKSLIKECVCEIQQSLAEKKNKKSEAPKAEKKNKKSEAPKAKKAPETKDAAKPDPKPAPVKKLTKKNLGQVAPPVKALTIYDVDRLGDRLAAAEKRGNTQSAKDLNLAKQAANFMLKTGKSKVD